MPPAQDGDGAGLRADVPCVLVVDDDAAFVTTLGIALRRSGVNTETASDPSTGLKLAAELRPAVILVDIMMPGIDGIEFARACRLNGVRSKLILMSGDLDAMRDANHAFAGAHSVIDKPLPIPALVQHLRRALS